MCTITLFALEDSPSDWRVQNALLMLLVLQLRIDNSRLQDSDAVLGEPALVRFEPSTASRRLRETHDYFLLLV